MADDQVKAVSRRLALVGPSGQLTAERPLALVEAPAYTEEPDEEVVAETAVAPRQPLRSADTVPARARWWSHLTDERLIVGLGVLLSVGFFLWYHAHGVTFAFADARSRELIARRVVVSRTPGLAQFGATWLPFNGFLMVPLIWNDVLFRSGLAAAIPSMLGFVVAGLYMYRIGRLVTSSRAGGWVAAAALMLNPSLLYMQSTAMSEITAIAAFIVATYYALRLLRNGSAADLAKCSTAVAAGTLMRYENWVLAVLFLPVVAYAGWRRHRYALAEGWTILYSVAAFAGCAAWVIYNTVIFHDPLLSFFYGQSSHTYYANTPAAQLPARNHPLMALRMYGLTVAGQVGWALVALAAVGLVVCLWRFRLRLTILPVYLMLFPLGFYWLVLERGINTISLPQLGQGAYYNVRFGLFMIPAVGVFLAVLAGAHRTGVRRVLLAVLLAVVVVVSFGELRATPWAEREALDEAKTGQQEAQWLSDHFHRGPILITYVNDSSLIFYLLAEHNVPDRTLITDANGAQFTAALAHPESHVSWIVMNSDDRNGSSRIWTALHRQKEWQNNFSLRASFPTADGTTQIYQRADTGGAPITVGSSTYSPEPYTTMWRYVASGGTAYYQPAPGVFHAAPNLNLLRRNTPLFIKSD